MPDYLVLGVAVAETSLIAAIRTNRIAVLGPWSLSERHPARAWLPRDPGYAYVDLADGAVLALHEGTMQGLGNLVSLVGYPELDAALSPTLPSRDDGPIRIDLELAESEVMDRMIGRRAIRRVRTDLTDSDIETAIQEKRFALNRSQVVGMIAAILTALDRPGNDRTVRTIVPAMMPLAPETLAGIRTGRTSTPYA